RRAASRAACTAGNRIATNVPMMAITTSSSTSVKPARQRTQDIEPREAMKRCDNNKPAAVLPQTTTGWQDALLPAVAFPSGQEHTTNRQEPTGSRLGEGIGLRRRVAGACSESEVAAPNRVVRCVDDAVVIAIGRKVACRAKLASPDVIVRLVHN